jgi:hypothetical protein
MSEVRNLHIILTENEAEILFDMSRATIRIPHAMMDPSYTHRFTKEEYKNLLNDIRNKLISLDKSGGKR